MRLFKEGMGNGEAANRRTGESEKRREAISHFEIAQRRTKEKTRTGEAVVRGNGGKDEVRKARTSREPRFVRWS